VHAIAKSMPYKKFYPFIHLDIKAPAFRRYILQNKQAKRQRNLTYRLIMLVFQSWRGSRELVTSWPRESSAVAIQQLSSRISRSLHGSISIISRWNRSARDFLGGRRIENWLMWRSWNEGARSILSYGSNGSRVLCSNAKGSTSSIARGGRIGDR